MIRIEGDLCRMEIAGRYTVYLDTDVLMTLAKARPEMQERFLAAMRKRGTLLFSIAGAMEVGRLEGRSADTVTALLSAIGPNWIPVEMDPFAVAEREGAGRSDALLSERLVTAFIQDRLHDLGPGADPSAATFFDLGALVAWAQKSRAEIETHMALIDDSVSRMIARGREIYDADPVAFDKHIPPIIYAAERRCAFVLYNLIRILVLEAKQYQLKTNDGIDLSHAVVGSAFGSLATVDKHWKRRLSLLPHPRRTAVVYYRPETEQLVATLEELAADTKEGLGLPASEVM